MGNKMAEQKDSNLTNLLEVPIGKSLTVPTARFIGDLHEIARQLNRARNAMARAWVRWREDHPDWQPPERRNKKGEPCGAFKSDLAPARVLHDGTPCVDDDKDGITFGTWLYHAGRKAAPQVAANLVSSASREVLANLQTDIKHHHNGRYRYRWQAIVDLAEQLPTWIQPTIPVPNNSACLGYMGSVSRKSASMSKLSESGCVLHCPLWSTSAGRAVTMGTFAVRVGVLSEGNRRNVRRIASCQWKMADSKLVFKNNRWQLQLTYQMPTQNLGLDQSRVAYVYPMLPNYETPFSIWTADRQYPWRSGNGQWLAEEYRRVEARRGAIRSRYKVATSGMKGHGAKRFFARLKPMARVVQNCQRAFTWSVIDDIVKFCKRFNTGTVIFREPALTIRDSLWLADRGVPYDWTGLVSNLKHKCRQLGIELIIERVWIGELRQRFTDEKPIGGNAVIDRKAGGKSRAADVVKG